MNVLQDEQIINKGDFSRRSRGIPKGRKGLVCVCLTENEGGKFRLGVLTELQDRRLKDFLIASVDGLKDSPEAINSPFPALLFGCVGAHGEIRHTEKL